MSYIYEEVKENDEVIWNSLNLKNCFGNPFSSYKKNYWSADKKNGFYLIHIGGYIDTPDFFDLSYRGTIVRMEVKGGGKGNIKDGAVFDWKITKICIPQSIWHEKNDVIFQIKKAFSVVRNRMPSNKVLEIKVEILCEPECVEVDYNGR